MPIKKITFFKNKENIMYDLIIIGGGPAGITAGIYAARKRLKTLFLTKDFIGQTGVAGEIENWPGEKSITGPELMEKFKEHLDVYDVEEKEEEVFSVTKEKNFVVKTEKGEYSSRAIILATGRKPRELKVPGEKEFIGKGVVYCTTCDAPLFKNKKVVVVGGGNAGFESAIELTGYASEVVLLEYSSSFSADEFLQEKAKKEGVTLYKRFQVGSIEGDAFVKKINCRDLETNTEKSFNVEGVFVQIGSDPIANYIKDLVEKNEGGDVIIDFKTNKTKTEGLFAAGDVTDVKSKQIVVATGEGAKASLSAYDYLKNLND